MQSSKTLFNSKYIGELAQLLQGIERFKGNMWVRLRDDVLHEAEITVDHKKPSFEETGCYINIYWRNAPGDGLGFIDLTRGSAHRHEKELPAAFAQIAELISEHSEAVLDTLVVHVNGKQIKVDDPIYACSRASWAEAFGISGLQPINAQHDPITFRKEYLRSMLMSVMSQGSSALQSWKDLHKNEMKLTSLEDVDFRNLNLEGINLGKMPLRKCNFNGLQLNEMIFASSDVSKSTFVGCNLQKANFYCSRAECTDFSKAQLQGSRFLEANLKGAKFAGADLSCADLSAADLIGTDLSDCNLTNATFIKATYNETTKLPSGDFPQWCELKWKGKAADPYKASKKDAATALGVVDFPLFMQHLQKTIDKSRLSKTMSMLKKDRFQLFSDIKSDSVTGIVKSQTDAELLYACYLNAKGEFACCTQNLNACGGLRGALCKHILVLVVGLTSAKELSPTDATGWVLSSTVEKPVLERERMTDIFLKYKGVEAGEVDWRPTETIPEDYYAF